MRKKYNRSREQPKQNISKDTIWNNKHHRQDTKAKFYKTTPDTYERKRLLETTEMKISRRISGKSLLERSANIWELCNVEYINEYITRPEQEWNDRINRMAEDRIVRINSTKKTPNGSRRRIVGRWCDNLQLTKG